MTSYQELQKDLEDFRSRSANSEIVREWLHIRWERIASHYTPRRLTVLTDRIVAISGITQLWKTHLPRSKSFNRDHWFTKGPHSHGQQSMDLPSSYLVDHAGGIAVLSSCNIITVEGRLRRAIWDTEVSKGALKQHPQDAFTEDGDRKPLTLDLAKVKPDAAESISRSPSSVIEIYLFEIGNCVGLKKAGPVGLILRATPTVTDGSLPRFTRLGLFHISPVRTQQKPCDLITANGYMAHDEQLKYFEKAPLGIIEIE
ncbi:hypothetical protein F5B20DRAFT_579573 [Whalleya microplaca]|nr:hypothetical protein F5B20DRAFT_579573 [Whalleya microplaca]